MFNTLVGTSENIRLYSTKKNKKMKVKNLNLVFSQWLAGLIDGDGYFSLSKKGYASLEITVDIRDEGCLWQIKNKYGGSIKLRSGTKSIRYRLHHKQGILEIIKDVNGKLRNPTRILQFNKILNNYNIPLISTSPLNYNNGWLAGMFDADGTITINKKNLQLAISVSQKSNLLLTPLINLYGGHIYIDRSSNTFKWYISKQEDIFNLIEYFKLFPSRTLKVNRLHLIPRFYELKELKKMNITTTTWDKCIKSFFKKWDSYTVE